MTHASRGRLNLVRQHAIHLTTVDPSADSADLQRFAALIGDARIVGLGEATHGSREVFQLKHRLIAYLVAELGFTTVALEAGWPECEVINRYVVDGQGDPGAALAALGFWTWDTEEVLALLHWLRTWNAGRPPDRKVRFAGVDVRFAARAVGQVRAVLTTLDSAAVALVRALDPIAALRVFDPPVDGEEEAWQAFGAVRERIAPQSEAWRALRDPLRILDQMVAIRRSPPAADRFTARDRAMAANVEQLLRDGGPSTKVVVWAHNVHVSRSTDHLFAPTLTTMGEVLADRYAQHYVAVGSAFGTGAFRAVVDPDTARLGVVRVGPPPAGSLDADLLAAATSPGFLLDLRRLPDSLAPWLGQEHRTREVGAVVTAETDLWQRLEPTARYDVLAFVAHTTPTRSAERRG